MNMYRLCLFYLATKNVHLATIFYHLVAKWRLKDFFNFEPGAIPVPGLLWDVMYKMYKIIIALYDAKHNITV